jgi:uncharacterized DUF497 family protein
MRYQWDRNKASTNLNKHSVDFADAVSVFSDELAITIFDERFEEERFITIGMDALSRILAARLFLPPTTFDHTRRCTDSGKLPTKQLS